VWAAHSDGLLVGKGMVSHPSGENDNLSLLDMQVHPDWRRRGVGSALLEAMLPAVTAAARTIVASWNVVKDTAAAAWADKLGFAVTMEAVVQGANLATIDRSLWGIPAPDGYRAEHWCNTAPVELVESYAVARTAIEDAPFAGSSYRPPTWTVERVRAEEEGLAKRNVEQRIVAAVHESTGAVIGLTAVEFYDSAAAIGYQHDTAVLAAHRGRGIGTFLKAEMLRRIAADRPTARRIHTSTDKNEPALKMNARVGYEQIRTAIVVEMPVSDFAARVAAIST
jgi:mycothiol synthase